jgi:hypothetical protein
MMAHLLLLIVYIIILVLLILILIIVSIIIVSLVLIAHLLHVRSSLLLTLHPTFGKLLHHLQKLLAVILEEVIGDRKNVACLAWTLVG